MHATTRRLARFTFGILLGALALAAGRAAERDDVIYHGVNWLQIGPGVITHTTVARLRVSGEMTDTVLITNPEAIRQIKLWALRNVYTRFDVSPRVPLEPDGRPVPALSLYSWRIFLTNPTWDFGTQPPTYVGPYMKIDEALLVYIPLLPQVLGVTPAQCEREIEALSKLVPAHL